MPVLLGVPSAGMAVHYLGVDRDAQLLAAAELSRLKEAHLLAAKRSQRLEASSWWWLRWNLMRLGGGHFFLVCVCVFFFELVYPHHRDMGTKTWQNIEIRLRVEVYLAARMSWLNPWNIWFWKCVEFVLKRQGSQKWIYVFADRLPYINPLFSFFYGPEGRESYKIHSCCSVVNQAWPWPDLEWWTFFWRERERYHNNSSIELCLVRMLLLSLFLS